MSYARKKILVGNIENDTKVPKEEMDYINIFNLGKYLLEELGRVERTYVKDVYKGRKIYCYFLDDEIVYRGELLGITRPLDSTVRMYLDKIERRGKKIGRLALTMPFLYDLKDVNQYWDSIFIAWDADFCDYFINGINVARKYELQDYYLCTKEFDYATKWVEVGKVEDVKVPYSLDYRVGKLEDRLGKQVVEFNMEDVKVTASEMADIEEALCRVMPDGCSVHSIAWHRGVNTRMYWRESNVRGEVDLLLI